MKNRLIKCKRGMGKVFQMLVGLMTALAAVSIVMVIAFLITANGKAQIVSLQGINESNVSTYTAAYNATSLTQAGLAIVPTWLGIIVIALIGSVLLSIVYAYMKNRR